MDLSHWNLVDSFTMREAACLAAGVDPALSRDLSAEQIAKVNLIQRALEKAYDSAVIAAAIALNEEKRLAMESVFLPTSLPECLSSNQLIEEVDRFIRIGGAFRLSRFHSNPDDDPIEMPTFSRQRLDAWFRAKRFKSIYGFVPAQEEIEPQKQLESQLTTRNHISDKLAKMNQAATKWWGYADRADRGTHPDNASVAAWLEQQGFSPTLASSAATIIRPEWVPTGRKPKE